MSSHLIDDNEVKDFIKSSAPNVTLFLLRERNLDRISLLNGLLVDPLQLCSVLRVLASLNVDEKQTEDYQKQMYSLFEKTRKLNNLKIEKYALRSLRGSYLVSALKIALVEDGVQIKKLKLNGRHLKKENVEDLIEYVNRRKPGIVQAVRAFLV